MYDTLSLSLTNLQLGIKNSVSRQRLFARHVGPGTDSGTSHLHERCDVPESCPHCTALHVLYMQCSEGMKCVRTVCQTANTCKGTHDQET